MNGQGQNDFQENEVSLQDYLRIIYRGRWIILISFLLIMTATVYFTFTAAPVYESSTLLMLSGRPGQTTALFQNPFMAGNYLKVNNEIEVLKSDYLARRVILKMKSSVIADSLYILGIREYNQKGVNFSGIIAGIKSGIKEILIGAVETDPAVIDTFERAIVRSLKVATKVEPIRDTEAIRLTVSSIDPYEAAYLANIIA
ncbi:MAG: hypothetical protein KAT54_07730, partial [Candidatus Marinimicrobia bacterium]|nr:hypothetical protein [Candidatus Neomarinimicrobiota bacterium]